MANGRELSPTRLAAATLLLAALSGCAAALREPLPLDQRVAPTAVPDADAVDGVLAEAATLFATRRIDDVRAAAAAWWRAGAGAPQRAAPWVGAAQSEIWLADHEPDAATRATAARRAVEAGQRCAAAAPGDPVCDYWLALALGIQARERRATALDALPRIVALLERVAAVRPELDHGGPHRVLALLLARAPGWPTGPGDPERGLEHGERAVALDPGYPPNWLCLAELRAATDDPDGSREAYRRGAELALRWIESAHPDAEAWHAEAEAEAALGRARGPARAQPAAPDAPPR